MFWITDGDPRAGQYVASDGDVGIVEYQQQNGRIVGTIENYSGGSVEVVIVKATGQTENGRQIGPTSDGRFEPLEAGETWQFELFITSDEEIEAIDFELQSR